jgi:uncharacterized SAM-dependent methyltransferase
MKYIINERQYKLITEEQEILHIPSLEVFGDWKTLQKFLERRGNPLFSIGGDLDLNYSDIETLGNLTSVGGRLWLVDSIIRDLGNLTSVGKTLFLTRCSNLTSLGNLTSVGGDLVLAKTPISKKYSRDEIRDMVDIGGHLIT